MISEVERYQGVVLRQILVAHGDQVSLGVADASGRVDSFRIEGAAFQIKYSAKRLPPWRFTYPAESLRELTELQETFETAWAILVCGEDGVVGLSFEELSSILRINSAGAGWVRVSRSRNSMYRVGGSIGKLPRAKPRGVQAFLDQILGGGTRVA